MRPREKSVEQSQLVEDCHRRRMHCVAAKIAQKVRVLFEDDDVDAGAGEKIAAHQPGGSAAGDDDVSRVAGIVYDL
jgi:hypothetical protein